MSSIEEVINGVELTGQLTELRDALIARENEACDLIRMAGAQFGLFPQVVAEVLAQAELGTPLSEQERGMIRTQYMALMEEIARQQREGGG